MLFSGTVEMKEWLCPNCNHLTAAASMPSTAGGCSAAIPIFSGSTSWVIVFYEPVPGFKIPPADHIMPAEISDRKWHSDEPVNRLVADTDHE
jgi:hypothetical protein